MFLNFVSPKRKFTQNSQKYIRCPRCDQEYNFEEQNKLKFQQQKELSTMQYMMGFKDLALKKRDDLLTYYIEENNQLKQKLTIMEKVLIKLKQQQSILNLQNTLKMNQTQFDDKYKPKKEYLIHQKQSLSGSRAFFFSPKKKISVKEKVLSPAQLQINRSQNSLYMPSLQQKTVTGTQGFPENQTFAINDEKEQLTDIFQCFFNQVQYKLEENKIQQNPKIKLMEEFLTNQNHIDKLNSMPQTMQLQIFETMSSLIGDLKNLMILGLKLKQLAKCTQIIISTLDFHQAFTNISNEISSLLNCEKVFTYLIDEDTEELSTYYKGENIRFKLGTGIASYVATQGIPAHVDNAEIDPRFDEQFDLKYQMKTKTVLAVPLKDNNGKIIGVLEANNKFQGAFGINDVGILEMVSSLVGIIIRNTQRYEKSIQFQKKLVQLFDTSIPLIGFSNIEQLMIETEEKLKEIMNTKLARIYLIDEKEQYYKRFSLDGVEELKLGDIGIVGEVYKTHLPYLIYEPYNNHLFNQRIDIDTNLPTATLPVMEQKTNKLLAIFQVVNVKSGLGLHKSLNQSELDILKNFSNILAICISRTLNLKDIMETQIDLRIQEFRSQQFIEVEESK